MVDYSRIEPLFLLENYNLALKYSEGYVFLKVLGRELVTLWYDPSQEIGSSTNLKNMAASTFQVKQFFSSQSSSINASNMLVESKPFRLYQAFMGIQPSAARVFRAIEGTEQLELDVGNWGTNSNYRFGYVSGYESSYDQPGPRSEFFIPYNLGYTFGVFNPMPYTISPQFYFVMNRMDVAVIRDAQTIQKILLGTVQARFAQIGGLTPPKYNMSDIWKVDPLAINASMQQIQAAVASR